MSGGTYIEIAGGLITETYEGTYEMFAENINFVAAKEVTSTGVESGTSYGNPQSPPISLLETGIDFIVEFEPLTQYDGEFGFDWLKCDQSDAILKSQTNNISDLEFVFDDTKMEYISVATDVKIKDKLKKEFNKIPMTVPYYSPWLSMSQRQGEIKLNMCTTALNGSDISKAVISFKKSDFYQVTIDGLVNENIKYIPDGKPKEISIKCIKPSKETDIVAVDEKGKIVGVIRAADNTKTYKLPIRLVCLVKDSATKDAEISQLISDFQKLGIPDYLNKNALNQVLIEADVEVDSKFSIAFDENVWNGNFYDKTNNYFINRKVAGGKVTYIDDDGIERKNVDYEHILDKFLRDYKDKFESDGKKYKGILLFITNIPKDPNDKEGGVSRTNPVNFREAIVFKPNLSNKSTYAHEISHALGLEHTFWNNVDDKNEFDKTKRILKENEETLVSNKQIIQKNKEALKTNQNNINIRNTEINKWKAEIAKPTYPYKKEAKDRIKYLEEQNKSTEEVNKKINEANKKGNKDNADIEGYIDKGKNNLLIYKYNKIKFKEKSTVNIMDYSANRNFLSFWQWKIMQNDVKSYYGSIIENK